MLFDKQHRIIVSKLTYSDKDYRVVVHPYRKHGILENYSDLIQ